MTDDRSRRRAAPGTTDARALMASLLAAAPPETMAVVTVLPGDTVDVVAEKVRAARAALVQIIFPAPLPEFQVSSSFAALRVLTDDTGSHLTVVSADQRTLDAAVRGKLEILPLDDGQPRAGVQRRNYETTALDALDDFDNPPDLPPPPRLARRAQAAAEAPARRAPDNPPRPLMRRAGTANVRGERAAVDKKSARAGRIPIDAVRPRRPILPVLLPLIVVVAAALLAAAWYFTSRVTLRVAPPAAVAEQPFVDQVIAVSNTPPTPDTPAVFAVPVSADAQYTASGTVSNQTITAVGRGEGQISITNTGPAIPLPAETEFIGINPAGQEVRFAIDTAQTIPGIAARPDLSGTDYGRATITVRALSPGSQGNVAANAINRIVLPGQQPLVSDRSNFLIRHEAIGGGSEQPLRVVTEDDVRRLLGEALTGLYNTGVQQLRAQIDEGQNLIDASTVLPAPVDLERPTSYDPPIVSPPVGQSADATTGAFSVAVRAQFRALATPADRSVSIQLQEAVRAYFRQQPEPPCPTGSTPGFAVSAWRWDGERLLISGAISCSSSGTLSPEASVLVRQAIQGKPFTEAQAALAELQRQGVIGDVALPQVRAFPTYDWLIEISTTP